jgi:anion-transporting  ArsA/GET3 family ATPase
MKSNESFLSKKLILMMGKGGVGKTTLATACAQTLASQGKRTLLIHVLQVVEEEQRLEKIAPNLWQITLRASDCFREYIMLKLKLKTLYTAFLGNKITQYLEKAAPGVREMVVLGKIWYERQNYDHVVVDMPSTGYALTMIHTPFNFSSLFPGGPIYHDSLAMIETFSNPKETALVTVTLPEEMPVQESLELSQNLKELMPKNPTWFVANRLIHPDEKAEALYVNRWQELTANEKQAPLWRALEHVITRAKNQAEQLARFKPDLSIAEVPIKDDNARLTQITRLVQESAGRA